MVGSVGVMTASGSLAATLPGGAADVGTARLLQVIDFVDVFGRYVVLAATAEMCLLLLLLL